MKCQVCRREFKPQAMARNIKYCSEVCADYAQRVRYMENKEREIAERKKRRETLAEINRKAREAGMTYGQYVCMMESK